MRLTVAAAILAETLPTVWSSSSNLHGFSDVITADSPKNGEEVHIQDFLAKKRNNMVRLDGAQRATGEKIKTMNLRRLSNSGGSDLQECNPSAKGADVGILSCGTGRYCAESEESSIGGYCATVEMSRNLQANSTLISDLYNICYGQDKYSHCTCSGVDVAAYTGSVSCTYTPSCMELPNACGENITFCYTQTYDLTVLGQYNGNAKSCYIFDKPKELAYCYTVVLPGDGAPSFCEIEVDGTTCNSCQSSQQYYQGSFTACTIFDCTNTKIATANTYCTYNIPTAQVQNTLLYDPLPCDHGCSLCGEGKSVVNTGVPFQLPNNDTYPCGVVELAALAGYFNGTDLCTELAGPVAYTCGCSGDTQGTVGGESETPYTPYGCNICGYGYVMTTRQATFDIPNHGAVTCSQLSEPGFVSSAECAVVQSLVQESCGCGPPSADQEQDVNEAPNENGVNANSGSFVLTSKAGILMVGATTLAILTSMFPFA
jgi:hypothetical protein